MGDMADHEYNFVEQPPAETDAAPPLPAEANGEENGDKGVRKEKRRSSRDGSGERRRGDRDRDEKRRRRSSRSRSRDRRRRSSRSRSPRDRRRRSRSPRERERQPYRRSDAPRFRREVTPPEVRAERAAAAEFEALDRDVRTVFAYNLSLKAEEKDIFQFFARAGPVNDIKVITDKNTGRSKGFAYIEFQRREDVINSLALTGQVLNGQAVMVKMSEAEKNLAWEAAEQAKRHQQEFGTDGVVFTAPVMPPPLPGMPGGAPLMAPAVASGPARLALSNLPTSITENDLRPIFEPFGPLDFLTLQRDMAARATGNAYVQYRLLSDATKAKENLAGLDLVGQLLGVAWAPVETPIEALAIAPPPPPLPPAVAAVEVLEEAGPGPEGMGGGIKLTGQSRAALMHKLAANAGLDVSNVPQIPLPQVVQPQMPTALALEQGLLGPASPIPTQCLLLKNMFAPEEETEDNWEAEIADDVGGECSKYGPVQHVYVDKNSRGFVYVKFGAIASATNAQRALHGRWFAARQIAADFQFTPIYNQHFGL